jgi:hypothetical protein
MRPEPGPATYNTELAALALFSIRTSLRSVVYIYLKRSTRNLLNLISRARLACAPRGGPRMRDGRRPASHAADGDFGTPSTQGRFPPPPRLCRRQARERRRRRGRQSRRRLRPRRRSRSRGGDPAMRLQNAGLAAARRRRGAPVARGGVEGERGGGDGERSTGGGERTLDQFERATRRRTATPEPSNRESALVNNC